MGEALHNRIPVNLHSNPQAPQAQIPGLGLSNHGKFTNKRTFTSSHLPCHPTSLLTPPPSPHHCPVWHLFSSQFLCYHLCGETSWLSALLLLRLIWKPSLVFVLHWGKGYKTTQHGCSPLFPLPFLKGVPEVRALPRSCWEMQNPGVLTQTSWPRICILLTYTPVDACADENLGSPALKTQALQQLWLSLLLNQHENE